MSRETTLVMSRVRNEARWIGRMLRSAFPLAATHVIFDDGSTDGTVLEVYKMLDERGGGRITSHEFAPITSMVWPDRTRLFWLRSPFRPGFAGHPDDETFDEVRDKNFLWDWIKSNLPQPKYVLCLDGDEELSAAGQAEWQTALWAMDEAADTIALAFIYLWDREDQRRVDGIFGDTPEGFPKLAFQRAFTTQRLDPAAYRGTHYRRWQSAKGFHCGWVPASLANPIHTEHACARCGVTPMREWIAKSAAVNAPILHYGYLDAADRQRKFEWYTRLDPNNKAEGYYLHAIGEPNYLCPGPVELVPWK